MIIDFSLWGEYVIVIAHSPFTANAKNSEVIKKYAEFGTINWKTEICFIKNSQNGNVYIGEKWKNISNKNISLV